MSNCVFCKKYAAKDGVVYENETMWVQFDPYPSSPGHMEVIPKKHDERLMDLGLLAWADMREAMRIAQVIRDQTDLRALYGTFAAKPLDNASAHLCLQALEHRNIGDPPHGLTVGVNDGQMAGQTIGHMHLHLIPRYRGDVADPRGGIRWVLPATAAYWRWR